MNLSTKNNYVSPQILHLSTYLGSFNRQIISNIIMVHLVHLDVSHRLIYWNTVFILLEMRSLKDSWNSPNQSAANCILFLSLFLLSRYLFSLSFLLLLSFSCHSSTYSVSLTGLLVPLLFAESCQKICQII